MPLARSLAYRYRGSSESVEDLVQVANLGLIQAVDRFDREVGASLVSYAVPTILGELRRHFRDRVYAIQLPRELQERIPAVDAAAARLAETLRRAPTVRELAAELGLRDEDVLEAQHVRDARVPRTLGHAAKDEGETPTLDRLGADDYGYDRVEASYAARQAGLDDREWRILRLRFGYGRTQLEISRMMGVSPMNVSRLIRGALRKLLTAVQARPTTEPLTE